jgi:tetratricopeptide (TPR) repeat protein
MGWAVAVIVITAAVHAQSAPHPCPADRPIDDIIGDIHKEQSNKKHRNKNPLVGPMRTPPTFPEPAPQVKIPTKANGRQNYSGALQRYNDAAEEKPEDLAIHVRLGRAFEKLGQLPDAIQEYKSAHDLAGPQKWSDEAKAALIRLQPAAGS